MCTHHHNHYFTIVKTAVLSWCNYNSTRFFCYFRVHSPSQSLLFCCKNGSPKIDVITLAQKTSAVQCALTFTVTGAVIAKNCTQQVALTFQCALTSTVTGAVIARICTQEFAFTFQCALTNIVTGAVIARFCTQESELTFQCALTFKVTGAVITKIW